MTPIQKIKNFIELGEQVLYASREARSYEFDMATENFLDMLQVEIHKIVKEYGLQKEYYDISNGTIFEYAAEEWLEKNPFNPESISAVK